MARRPLKRHLQQPLFRPHGGRRKGAGRPVKKGKRPSERHQRRPVLRASEPLHVVTRVVPSIGSLRTGTMYSAIREATITAMMVVADTSPEFRIVHLSIQRTHLHLIVEAANRLALSKGMQGFLIAAAKYINRAISERTGERRRGSVFADRYHARPLSTPRQVRNCLAYVLNNWRHHDEHRHGVARSWKIDPFSTALRFGGWRGLEDLQFMYRQRSTYLALAVWLPKTWLLRASWQRHGSIGEWEVPGPRPCPRPRPRDTPATRSQDAALVE